jgi:hypothetical protein
MELSLARKYDPILLKDGFQFFFIKQGSIVNPVPNYSSVTLAQLASSYNSVDVHPIFPWLCCH